MLLLAGMLGQMGASSAVASRYPRGRNIRHCRSLDMTLDEVRPLLAAKDAPTESCVGVNELIDAHIQRVR